MKSMKILSALAAAALLALCVPAVAEAQSSGAGPTVYVAGSHGSVRIHNACYWVNAGSSSMSPSIDGAANAADQGLWVKTDLPTLQSRATAITIADGKIYVAGFYTNNGTNIACYWVDGIKVDLPGRNSRSTAITVVDGKVYIAGYYGEWGDPRACYWVDGISVSPMGSRSIEDAAKAADTEVSVSPMGSRSIEDAAKAAENIVKTDLAASRSEAEGITVLSGKVYMSGWYDDNGTVKACYWVDGVKVDITTLHSYAFGSTTRDGKLYIAGYDFSSGNPEACYWVDEVSVSAMGSRSIDAAAKAAGNIVKVDLAGSITGASAIAIADGKVYAAGTYSDDTIPKACMWIDGVKTDLSSEDSSTGGIAVSGRKVYVAGSYHKNDVSRACIWVDGVKTDLNNEGSVATAIMIVE